MTPSQFEKRFPNDVHILFLFADLAYQTCQVALLCFKVFRPLRLGMRFSLSRPRLIGWWSIPGPALPNRPGLLTKSVVRAILIPGGISAPGRELGGCTCDRGVPADAGSHFQLQPGIKLLPVWVNCCCCVPSASIDQICVCPPICRSKTMCRPSGAHVG